MQYDVIVIGGSYAGMAAALQLLRAHRQVLVIDAGQRRNRFAHHAHGFLGQDGVDPAVIAADARKQLEVYPTLTWRDAKAVKLRGTKDKFEVETEGNETYSGRRILFALGVSDELPAIAGLAERWGKHVFHCPYCHGYELNQGSLGVIATGPMSVHQAQMIPEWGATTFFTNCAVEVEPAIRADLTARGVTIEEVPISRLEGKVDIVLQDGRNLSFAGLFTATKNAPSSPIAQDFGCALEETPFGTQIATDEAKRTNIEGVFACGDAAKAPHSVTFAVADGAWAGAQIHRSFIWPDE